jgi:hypothetical protein
MLIGAESVPNGKRNTTEAAMSVDHQITSEDVTG